MAIQLAFFFAPKEVCCFCENADEWDSYDENKEGLNIREY